MSQKFDVHVPVLIVGGGGAGLTSSILLSRLGVPSLLVTRYPGTTTLPRGHSLNQRSMEIFTDMGVSEDIRRRATPQENAKAVVWYSGLAGGGPGGRARPPSGSGGVAAGSGSRRRRPRACPVSSCPRPAGSTAPADRGLAGPTR
ncbi:FAD-dependent monooxygenase [Streptomyces flaveolus]|uniref:FAD-dependent monooxygenase n=1 Tax=Streptomyces flaveolus TaxID=67297 RepID=UPI003431A549